MMTIEQIEKRLAEIKAVASDDERAHSEQDDLFEDFIRSLDTPEAKKVLEVLDIEFSRWCA